MIFCRFYLQMLIPCFSGSRKTLFLIDWCICGIIGVHIEERKGEVPVLMIGKLFIIWQMQFNHRVWALTVNFGCAKQAERRKQWWKSCHGVEVYMKSCRWFKHLIQCHFNMFILEFHPLEARFRSNLREVQKSPAKSAEKSPSQSEKGRKT